MAAHFYECLFIFDSNRYARDPGNTSAAITQAIESLGGNILVSRLWAEQKLAYPIDGHHKGTYWLTYFSLESTKLKELNRTYQLNESIVRFMFNTIDARLIDALVAHAQGKQTPTSVEDVKIGVPIGADEEEIEDEVEEDLE